MARVTFEATVIRPDGTGSGTFVVVPLDIRALFGRARPPVRVTINDYTWRSTIAVYGGQPHIGIAREHREAAGIAPGDRISVSLESDEEPRVVELPADLAAGIAADADVAARFERMPYTHRLEYARWIEEARRPETRARRIEAAVQRIRESLPVR
jgi:hypothetical protein